MKYLHTYHKQRMSAFSAASMVHIDCPEMVVVVPCYRESMDDVRQCIDSLLTQTGEYPDTLILFLINYKASDSQSIKNEAEKLKSDIEDYLDTRVHDKLSFHVFLKELSGKSAGVGMARKILMDMAFGLFYESEKNGIIINLDADTTVHSNYLNAVYQYFNDNEKVEAASIAFYHPTASMETDVNKYQAALYELHLRYFINMQRTIGLPYAFQTIGSAMAVRAWAYAKEGGMNKRQAGEDFYFLHKFISKNTLGEINNTWVIPSSRTSDRVPFGTGKAISDALLSPDTERLSYNPESFILLGQWIRKIENARSGTAPSIKSDDQRLNRYLIQIDAERKINEIESNTTSKASFSKRFFQWFDAFMLMKYLHFMRDNGLPDVKLSKCIAFLFENLDLDDKNDPIANLNILRKLDQNASIHGN